ncbi:hypothetical protein D3C83_14710 [compost metagenome]
MKGMLAGAIGSGIGAIRHVIARMLLACAQRQGGLARERHDVLRVDRRGALGRMRASHYRGPRGAIEFPVLESRPDDERVFP